MTNIARRAWPVPKLSLRAGRKKSRLRRRWLLAILLTLQGDQVTTRQRLRSYLQSLTPSSGNCRREGPLESKKNKRASRGFEDPDDPAPQSKAGRGRDEPEEGEMLSVGAPWL